ncbi:hypothetical protein L7F22_012441 [Adiantum nelumboides]|nr:hypothetical protein [Adiantum nelumboides]
MATSQCWVAPPSSLLRLNFIRYPVALRDGRGHSKSVVLASSPAGEQVQSVDLFPLQEALSKKDGDAVMDALEQLRQAGWAKMWNSQPYVSRRTTFVRELTTLGIKNAEKLGIPSVRDDAAFLWTVVGVTSVLAVLAGQLPGDWGFFVPYLIGSISLVVLGIGSIAPGVLQAAIVSFSSVFEDYQDRVLRHEAAHFLVAYLLGVPIVGYSLDIGKEHVNLVDEKIQKRIYEGKIDSKELDKLAVVAMAGLAAEGLKYDKVTGQSADLFSLQRLINRTKPPLSSEQQQNLTRWAENDWVLLRFEKARLGTKQGKERLFPKLSMRYYGPFHITEQINDVSFQLKLPDTWKIHNAFHVSLLKPFKGDVPDDGEPNEQPEVEENKEILVPEQILAHKDTKNKGKVRRRFLVKFKNYPALDAKWMEEEDLADTPQIVNLYLEAFGLA